MRLKPAYFKVVEPLRVWRHVGMSESNTYIGRSLAITTVKDAVDAVPGDELHDLPGGTFVTGPDGTFEVSLAPPVPILESRHHHVLPQTLVAGLVSAGRLSEIRSPRAKVDYGAPRKATSANRLPRLHPDVRRCDPSPELRLARGITDRVVAAMGDVPYTRRSNDVSADAAARDIVTVEGGTITVAAVVGRVMVVFTEALAPRVTAGLSSGGERRVTLDDPASARDLAGALADDIGTMVAEAHEPVTGPRM